MMMQKLRSRSRGFSLVELLVTLLVLGIVLAFGYNFFFFGLRSFAIGESRSNLQRDLRLIGDWISREVRNATEIEVSAVVPSVDGEYYYLYWDNQEVSFVDLTSETVRTEMAITAVNFEIKSRTNYEGRTHYFLAFTLTGENDENQVYTVESEVLLNNISDAVEAQNMPVVRYKKP